MRWPEQLQHVIEIAAHYTCAPHSASRQSYAWNNGLALRVRALTGDKALAYISEGCILIHVLLLWLLK